MVWGLPGAGKTVSAVFKMQQARAEGRRVLANFHSTSRLWEFGSWQDMQDADNCLCVVDEAFSWFSSRHYHEQSKEDLGVFMQSRKSGLDLMLVVQHPDRLDKAIREVAHVYMRCSRVGPLNFIKWHDWTERNKKGYRYEMYYPTRRLLDSYFTEEIIGDRSGTKNRLGRTTAYGRLAYSWEEEGLWKVTTCSEPRATMAEMRGFEVVRGMLRKGRFVEIPKTLSVSPLLDPELEPAEVVAEVNLGRRKRSRVGESGESRNRISQVFQKRN